MMKKFCHFRRPTQLHGYTEDMLLTVTPLAFSQIGNLNNLILKNLGEFPHHTLGIPMNVSQGSFRGPAKNWLLALNKTPLSRQERTYHLLVSLVC
jgi:hypothetical protein